MPRSLKIGFLAAAVAAVVLIGGLAVLARFIDPAPYFQQAADRVREGIGRELRIGGRVELRVLPSLRLVLEDVSLANAPWGSRPDMLRVKRVEARVALLPLLRGEIEVGRLELIEPDVLLETDAKGLGNWVFEPPAGDTSTPAKGSARSAAIEVHAIAIDGGRIAWQRAGRAGRQELAIEKLRVARDTLGRKADVDLTAATNGQAMTLRGSVGTLRALLDRTASWPVDVVFATPGARLALDGTLDWRTTFPTFDGTARGELTDTAAVARLAGGPIGLPLPVSFEARARATRGEFTIAPLKASIGNHPVEGQATVRTAGERPYVKLEVRAAALDLSAAGQKRAQPAPRAATSRGGRVFSDDPLPLDLLRGFDADADVAIGRLITAGKLPVEDLAARATLRAGKLDVRPASAKIGGGAVSARASLDAARSQAPTLALQLDGRGIDLQQVAAAMGQGRSVQGGRLEVAATLRGPGSSVRSFAAGANGEVRIVATGPVRLTGTALDLGGDVMTKIADTVNPFRRTERGTEIGCAVAILPVRDGIATVQRTIAVETNRVHAVAAGTINFRTEALDLAIRPTVVEGIGIGAASLAEVVRITGTLAEPAIGIDTAASARAALSVGGAVATGGLSLLGEMLFTRVTADRTPCQTALAGGHRPRSGEAPAPPRQGARDEAGVLDSVRRLFR
jgi:uncharacterized protein involved in outer membrane biogenesis